MLQTASTSLSAQRPAAPAADERSARIAADTAGLRRTLDSLVAPHRGVVGYAIHDLESGARLGHRADEPFPTASLIKVPILVTLFDLVAEVDHGDVHPPVEEGELTHAPGERVKAVLGGGEDRIVRPEAGLGAALGHRPGRQR